MQPKAIKVNPDVKGAELDTSSRLNYAKVYNIEHNVKVKNFGSLNPESLRDLIQCLRVNSRLSQLPRTAKPSLTGLDKVLRPAVDNNTSGLRIRTR
jgi:hypothetical protein